MNTSRMSGIGLAAALAAFASTASADHLLEVDLSVTNQITISATSGVSAVTISGSQVTGFYLENLLAGGSGSLGASLVSGNLTSAENASDGSPVLYRFGLNDPGLNVYSFTTDSQASFTAGGLAFSGTATWNVSEAAYAALTGGATEGNVYFPADDLGDLPTAQILGTYLVIPAPGAIALLGLAGLAGSRRRD